MQGDSSREELERRLKELFKNWNPSQYFNRIDSLSSDEIVLKRALEEAAGEEKLPFRQITRDILSRFIKNDDDLNFATTEVSSLIDLILLEYAKTVVRILLTVFGEIPLPVESITCLYLRESIETAFGTPLSEGCIRFWRSLIKAIESELEEEEDHDV